MINKISENKTIEFEKDISMDNIIELINNMITEYDAIECDNHVKYPLDSEVELYRKGRYGAMALDDLLDRIDDLLGRIPQQQNPIDKTTEGNK